MDPKSRKTVEFTLDEWSLSASGEVTTEASLKAKIDQMEKARKETQTPEELGLFDSSQMKVDTIECSEHGLLQTTQTISIGGETFCNFCIAELLKRVLPDTKPVSVPMSQLMGPMGNY